MFSNNNFQFLNNITRIFTHFLSIYIFIHIFKRQFLIFKHINQTSLCFYAPSTLRRSHGFENDYNNVTQIFFFSSIRDFPCN